MWGGGGGGLERTKVHGPVPMPAPVPVPRPIYAHPRVHRCACPYPPVPGGTDESSATSKPPPQAQTGNPLCVCGHYMKEPLHGARAARREPANATNSLLQLREPPEIAPL